MGRLNMSDLLSAKNCDWAAPIDDSPEAKACAEQSVASVLGWVSPSIPFAEPFH